MKKPISILAALCGMALTQAAEAQTATVEHCVTRQSVPGAVMRMPDGVAAVIKAVVLSPERCKNPSAPMLATFEPRTTTNQTVWIDPVVGKVSDAEASAICKEIRNALERGTAKQHGELLARYSDTDVTAARCAALESQSGTAKR
jgi:hypothetical protein